MIKFSTPALEKEFRECLDRLRDKFSSAKDFEYLLSDFTSDEESDEEILLTTDTVLALGIADFLTFTPTVQEFIDFVKEFETAIIIDDRICWTSKRVLFKVEPHNFEAFQFIQHAVREVRTEEEKELLDKYIELKTKNFALRKELNHLQNDYEDLDKELVREYLENLKLLSEYGSQLDTPTEHFCCQKISIGNNSFSCMLTTKFTMFGFKLLADGNFIEDDYLPVYEDDVFVEIQFQSAISIDLAINIYEAYLFELSASLEVVFKPSPREKPQDYSEEDECPIFSPRLRPLLIGKGMLELLKLYNRGVTADYSDMQILYLTKVIEYVSQTVVQQQFLEVVRKRLLHQDALNPDAKFINDLAALIYEQREYRLDKEAIRLTIQTCCDAVELGKYAPQYLSDLRNISQNSKSKEKEEVLSRFAYSLSATRNSIAHAKANYQPTGEECPVEELQKFASMVAVTAQQAIRWFNARHETTRVY